MALEPVYHRCVRVLDIDGTVVRKRKPSDYFLEPEALPDAVEMVNEWFEAGDYIVFWTARPWEYRERTIAMLDKLGFLFHEVICNKPYSHDIHWYDDNQITSHLVERDQGIGTLDTE